MRAGNISILHRNFYGKLLDFFANRNSGSLIISGEMGYGSLPLTIKALQWKYCKEIQKSNSREGCQRCHSCRAISSLNHLDVLMIVPAASSLLKKDRYEKIKEFLIKNPYAEIDDVWDEIYETASEPQITVEEAELISEFACKPPALSTSKTIILWHADHMNTTAANKLLKIIEEPPVPVFFVFLPSNMKKILPTIISRSVVLKMFPVPPPIIKDFIIDYEKIDIKDAELVSLISDGNINTAISLIKSDFIKKMESIREFFILAYRQQNGEAISKLEDIINSRREAKEFLKNILIVLRLSWMAQIHQLPHLSLLNDKLQKFIKGLGETLQLHGIHYLSWKVFKFYLPLLSSNINIKILLSNFIIDLNRVFKKTEHEFAEESDNL